MLYQFKITWPMSERIDYPIRIGITHDEFVDKRPVIKNGWFWELPSKDRICLQYANGKLGPKAGFADSKYPSKHIREELGENWELPETFGLEIDSTEGSFGFRVNGRYFGKAYTGCLKGKKKLKLAFFANLTNASNVVVWQTSPERRRIF